MKKHIFTLGIMLVFAGVLSNSVNAEVSSVQDVINLYNKEGFVAAPFYSKIERNIISSTKR